MLQSMQEPAICYTQKKTQLSGDEKKKGSSRPSGGGGGWLDLRAERDAQVASVGIRYSTSTKGQEAVNT